MDASVLPGAPLESSVGRGGGGVARAGDRGDDPGAKALSDLAVRRTRRPSLAGGDTVNLRNPRTPSCASASATISPPARIWLPARTR